MSELLKQASRIQRKVDETRQKFREREFEVEGASGRIKVRLNGAHEIVALTIEPDFLRSEDPSMVQDAVVGTVNAAFRQVTETLDAEIEKATGGVKLPGLY